MSEAKFVSRAVRKKDAQALVTGKPVYTGRMYPRAGSPPPDRPILSPAPMTV